MSRESAVAPRQADVIYSNVTSARCTTTLGPTPHCGWMWVMCKHTHTEGYILYHMACFSKPPHPSTHPSISHPYRVSSPIGNPCSRSLFPPRLHAHWLPVNGREGEGGEDLGERHRKTLAVRAREWGKWEWGRGGRGLPEETGRCCEWQEEEKRHKRVEPETGPHFLTLCGLLDHVPIDLVLIAF